METAVLVRIMVQVWMQMAVQTQMTIQVKTAVQVKAAVQVMRAAAVTGLPALATLETAVSGKKIRTFKAVTATAVWKRLPAGRKMKLPDKGAAVQIQAEIRTALHRAAAAQLQKCRKLKAGKTADRNQVKAAGKIQECYGQRFWLQQQLYWPGWHCS